MPATIPIRVDRSAGEPLYRQVEAQIRAAIATGRLRPGTLLPGIRSLADSLGVARITVRTAYDQLASEGFVCARVGSGTRVADRALTEAAGSNGPGTVTTAASPAASRPPVAAARIRGSDVIDLRPGSSEVVDFPFGTWERLLREAVRELAAAGTSPQPVAPNGGDDRLREVLAARLAHTRSILCEPEQIVITTGDWASLSTIVDVWADPDGAGDPSVIEPAYVEDPTEAYVHELLSRRGHRLVPVPVDDDGLRVSDIRAPTTGRGGLVHVSPAWSPIAGGVLSDLRRDELLALASAPRSGRRLRIVEDDRDADIRYAGPPPAALASIDDGGRVIHVRGLERELFPGARIGYFVVPRAEIPRLSAMLELVGRGPGVIEQRALARFIADGLFDRHLRRLRHRRAQRQEALLEAIDRHARGLLAVAPAIAGGHLVATILRPAGAASELAARARSRGLRLVALSSRRAADGPDDRVLLAYAGHSPERLAEGIRRLAAVASDRVGSPVELSRQWAGPTTRVGAPRGRETGSLLSVRAEP